MKLLLIAALLSAAAPLPSALAPASHPDYSGTWTLDKTQSQDLPPWFANLRQQRIQVAQSDAHLTVHVELDEGAAEPQRIRFDYALDGTETQTTTRVRVRDGMADVPTRLRAAHGDDGRLHITIARDLRMGERTVTATGTEEWELRPDGRTLVVHRVEQMPQGEARFTMVFVRA
ncbi:MAG TPA: hypothetical protein VF665_13670 [Longimicrobium sp.]|jgi:hypothetical protein|uniref:hypothetical protein n=1 Tax=Longimicrobium sp. TaxID=2029185 RepID=UPI002ED9B891